MNIRTMNPLAHLARKFPRAFGLEWVETEEMFPTSDQSTFDLRPIRHLSGGFVPVGWTYDPSEDESDPEVTAEEWDARALRAIGGSPS